MIIRLFIFGCLLLCLNACERQPPLPSQGTLGYSDQRRVLIVGENIDPAIAAYYEKQYDALVWFTSYRGDVAHFTNNVVESGIGPSRAMRALIVQLQSINHSMGRWEIYVPGMAQNYFLRTLKHMEDGALAHARGSVVLIETDHAPQIEQELQRVTQGSFFVEYEKSKKQ